MNHEKNRKIKHLLEQEHFAVLASAENNAPYTNLVAFVNDRDLNGIYFATSKNTRKYHKLSKNPKVSLMIDNRSNHAADLTDAIGLNLCGTAKEVNLESKKDFAKLLLAKNPGMEAFLKSPTTTIFKITPETGYFVENFQTVTELHFEKH